MDVPTLLKQKGIIDDKTVASIHEEMEQQGVSLEAALLKRGVSVDDILATAGEYYNIPTRRLEGDRAVPYEILKYIPEESARHYQYVPLAVVDGVLEVGTVDPDNLEGIEALNFITGRTGIPYKLFLISEKDFQSVLTMYRGLTGEVGKALNELETTIIDDASDEGVAVPDTAVADKLDRVDIGGGTIKEDAPVTKIVATILRYAVDGKASDIHIEPTRESLRVRFRRSDASVAELA